MTDLFDPFYAEKFRALRKNHWEKETVLEEALGIILQDVSKLVNGEKHFTEGIIAKICAHYRIPVAEFKKLSYTDMVMVFVRQLSKDAGGSPFNDQSEKIKNLEISICLLRKENLNLASENSHLTWEAKKARRAAEIVSEKVRSKIYVPV